MSIALREALGLTTLIAIIWDTIVTIILLKKMFFNEKRIDKLEEIANEQKATIVNVTDLTSLIQAGCALITAALTTYTLISLIKKERQENGAKSKPDVPRVHSSSNDSASSSGTGRVGKNPN